MAKKVMVKPSSESFEDTAKQSSWDIWGSSRKLIAVGKIYNRAVVDNGIYCWVQQESRCLLLGTTGSRCRQQQILLGTTGIAL